MKKPGFGVIAVLTAVLLVSLQSMAVGKSADKDRDLGRVSKMIHEDVQNQQGKKLGRVEDIVIGKSGSQIYVIMSGKNDQLIPIPFSVLRQGKENKFLVLNLDENQLVNAPSFSNKEWPDLSQQVWNQRIINFYEGASVSHAGMQ